MVFSAADVLCEDVKRENLLSLAMQTKEKLNNSKPTR